MLPTHSIIYVNKGLIAHSLHQHGSSLKIYLFTAIPTQIAYKACSWCLVVFVKGKSFTNQFFEHEWLQLVSIGDVNENNSILHELNPTSIRMPSTTVFDGLLTRKQGNGDWIGTCF
jgi:hypothetical protein